MLMGKPEGAFIVEQDEVEVANHEGEDSAWRNELSARLNRYRARRKAPPPRYPSLRLPFERVEPPVRASEQPIGVFQPISTNALALDGMHVEPTGRDEVLAPEPVHQSAPVVTQSVGHTTAKIIEFPRFAWGPPSPPPDQLAEPIMDRPRILEVPEVAPLPPALGGITIEPAEMAEPEKRLGIDIPLQSASIGLRIIAALVDGLLVAVAAAMFGFVFWKVAAVQPPRLQMMIAGAGLLTLLWATYQYVLIVYAANTPGLRTAGLTLNRFDGSATTRSLRRWRVLGSYLSALSLGMGYAWIFLDEDALCWHDRITHTYLAPRRTARQ
jgi:RDD family